MKSLADELGVPWQRLDKALRHGTSQSGKSGAGAVCTAPPPPPLPAKRLGPIPPERAVLTKASIQGPGLLAEKYRPTRLSSIFGQPLIVNRLKAYASAPYPAAFLFAGETGTGKTSAALALASELGCILDEHEFGGVHVLASGEQSSESVRECFTRMWRQPMKGSGWKVFILNEAERMHVQAETIWLDRLENIPPRTAIVFSTNHAEKLSQRFRDRCMLMRFESDARRLEKSARMLLARIWKAETGRQADSKRIDEIVTDSSVSGHLSFRRAVQLLQPQLPLRKRKA